MTAEAQKKRSNRSYIVVTFFCNDKHDDDVCWIISAFVVSKSRTDWMKDFAIPLPFFYSLVAIIFM
jgi:cytochrome c oxidase subunit 3